MLRDEKERIVSSPLWKLNIVDQASSLLESKVVVVLVNEELSVSTEEASDELPNVPSVLLRRGLPSLRNRREESVGEIEVSTLKDLGGVVR